jgi:hypothetical protein
MVAFPVIRHFEAQSANLTFGLIAFPVFGASPAALEVTQLAE